MLKLKDIQKKYVTAEKTVKIDAWGGEVKIRQLTVDQSAEAVFARGTGGNTATMIKTAAFALVEPEMSEENIRALSDPAFKGIIEIVTAVGSFSEPKK